jgi:predicted N-acetyltransferase YhbS
MSEKDEQALTKLLRKDFSLFNNEDYWVWKYKKNPNFDSSLVIVAEKDQTIVGCNHWLTRELKLSNNLKIKAALAGDLLVHPDHRGCGVAAELLRTMRSSEAIRAKNLSLTYMFAPLKLNSRLYEPVVGYIAAPNSTCTYRKIFNCKELKSKISKFNLNIQKKTDLKEKLKKINLAVFLNIVGSPPFTMRFNGEGVFIEEDNRLVSPDIIIEGIIPLSSAIFEGKFSSRKLIVSFLTRKIIVRKGISKIFSLQKALKILKSASL